ncbi:uncharacterized protein RSE6_06354 [Rhynchosporium secalis]|uniref:Uncharacterized protein n=1 Tax=Rhynchosporium secalis TaxID=38038 RepID=A0A1E1MA88_RHYSE|nr:uncharacterized protein RSE6_06354 [Rhynchosporium secalis]
MVHARSSRRSRPSFRPSQPRTRASSLSSSSSHNSSSSSSSTNTNTTHSTNYIDTTYIDTIGGVTIHLSKLGFSNSKNAHYPRSSAWQADMKVYLDAKGMGDYIRPSHETDNFTYIEDEVHAKMDRERKAMIWFSVEEGLRREHLLDLCERNKTSEDVWRRIHERLGAGKVYVPLPELCVDEEF